MPRVKPRTADYSSAPKKKARRVELPGELTVGPATKRLALLLSTPRTAVDAEKALDELQEARGDSDAFLRAMTEGEE